MSEQPAPYEPSTLDEAHQKVVNDLHRIKYELNEAISRAHRLGLEVDVRITLDALSLNRGHLQKLAIEVVRPRKSLHPTRI